MKGARKREDAEGATATKKRKTRTDTDQVAAALRKIRRCVGVPSKFNKATQLLLNLLQEGHVTQSHAALFFEVWPSPLGQAAWSGLLCGGGGVGNGRQESVLEDGVSKRKKQLEVYQIWTICQSELHTDDSFVFGKSMSKLRELALQLPVSQETDEEALKQWKDKMERLRELYEKHHRSLDREDSSLEMSLTWTEEECLAARREAIVEWLEAAKDVYRLQWACTAIDMSITELNENRERFCQDQRARIEALLRFSKDQKMRRRQGPSAKEKRRDTNAFDEARSEWSKAEVTGKGMVGGSGDHKSEAWLG